VFEWQEPLKSIDIHFFWEATFKLLGYENASMNELVPGFTNVRFMAFYFLETFQFVLILW